MTPGSQTQADRAADAGSSAAVTDLAEVQALLVEIFARTGQKVELNDPLVAAALIHSTMLRRAGNDAAQAIAQAAQSLGVPQPINPELQRAIGWLSSWHAKAMLATVLFALCFLASTLGTVLASSRCH